MLSVTLKLLILSVVTLIVVMLNVIILSVVAPTRHNDSQDSIQHSTKKMLCSDVAIKALFQ